MAFSLFNPSLPISRPNVFSCSLSLSSRAVLSHLPRGCQIKPTQLRIRAQNAGTAMAPSSQFPNLFPSPDVVKLWRNAEAVCFDVDSTVCLDEGIDELANFCGAGEEVAAWTARAMGGSVPFEDALAARLGLFKPSLSCVESYLANNPSKISPGIADLVKKLRSRGTQVYLISGGFRQMIAPVAKVLQIPEENIFANRLLFDAEGQFAGFDKEEPTSRSGGKAAAISKIKQV